MATKEKTALQNGGEIKEEAAKSKVGRKRGPGRIAGTREILAYFTKVMRNDIEGEKVCLSDSFKAAELLAKYYSLFPDRRSVKQKDVVIVDNV